jgi:hypothetical protein
MQQVGYLLDRQESVVVSFHCGLVVLPPKCSGLGRAFLVIHGRLLWPAPVFCRARDMSSCRRCVLAPVELAWSGLHAEGGHVRTVPLPDWVKSELDEWLAAAVIEQGKLFRRVNKVGRAWGDGMTEKAVWHIVKESAKSISVAKLAARSASDLCSALPRYGRRVRTNPVSIGARFGANDRTVPWLQAANSISSQ